MLLDIGCGVQEGVAVTVSKINSIHRSLQWCGIVVAYRSTLEDVILVVGFALADQERCLA